MLVSVIIPTFNRAGTILPAVESALAQTHQDLEVIVVDDGSTDGTADVLDQFGRGVKVVRQANAGPSAARNRGVRESKGAIVAFLDSDDHWTPDKIERQVNLMERAGDGMCCCVCNAVVKDEDGGTEGHTFDFSGINPGFIEGEWTNPEDVLATRFLLFNQVVAIRREAFEKVGGFNESLRLLEDYELSIRLSVTGTWGVISDPLVIKYNDTRGIGVECMADHEKHTRVRAKVISDILAGGFGLGKGARGNLQRSLDELETEVNSITMIKRGDLVSKSLGRALGFSLRARRAVRRRSPSWPAFQGRPITL
jgi:glycosyltransferase involved in cell wall biosynthesis